MPDSFFLCSDLDRTLLPNGPQEESPQARPLLRRLAARREVALAYVSGRHEALLREAIEQYALPLPDVAVGDVGSTIFEIRGDAWTSWPAWEQEIAPDWGGRQHDDIAGMLLDLDMLRPQEPAKQNRFKVSYYAAHDLQAAPVIAEVTARLAARGIRASVIWSIDETVPLGLLDVLPARATKYHAVEFLMSRRGHDAASTMFAGDSGNDLPVLTSGLQSVLVRNALDSVRAEAVRILEGKGLRERLYLAQGGFADMNGNYAAGVLEGFAHFFPVAAGWLTGTG